MSTLVFNPTDWKQGQRAIIQISGQANLAEVTILEWSPSAKFVKLRVPSLPDMEWRKPDTDWQLVERLGGVFGR